MPLVSLSSQLFLEKFHLVSASVQERKTTLLATIIAGSLAYPLLSKLNANRFVCLSLSFFPPLFGIGWSVHRFQKTPVQKETGSVQDQVDLIWRGATTLPSGIDRLAVIQQLREKIGKEERTPRSVVYFLLRANGWSDQEYCSSSKNSSVKSKVVETALNLLDSDSERMGCLKNKVSGGRADDGIQAMADELALEKQIDQKVMEDACFLLVSYRKWYAQIS